MKVETLEKRFKKSSNLIICITLLFGIIFTNVTFYSVFYQDFVKKLDQVSSVYRNHISFYISSMEESAKLVSQNAKVIDAIKSPKYQIGITDILDGAVSSDDSILGISVYSTSNNVVYTSNNVSMPPKLQNLLDKSFRDKKEELSTGTWIIMDDDIDSFAKAGVYKTFNTIKLYSYMSAIESKGESIGYVVMNTDLKNIYKIFKDTETEYFSDLSIYIAADKDNVYSADKQHLKYDLRFENNCYSQNGRLFSYEYLPDFNIGIFVSLGLEKFYTDVLFNLLITLVISLICYLLYLLCINEIIKSITLPIDRLRNKMKNLVDKI